MDKLKLLVILLIAAFLIGGCEKFGGEEDISYVDIEELAEEGAAPTEEAAEETEEITGAVVTEAEEEEEEVAEKPKEKPTISVEEGELVSIKVKGYDPDGDPLTYTFSEPLDEDGQWQTEKGDSGLYKATITASDGKATTSQTITIEVTEKNIPPVMARIADVALTAGETVSFEPKVTDENENDVIKVSYSGWMDSSSYTTTEDDVGDHTVTVTASDGKAYDRQTVVVTVLPLNTPPVIEKLDDIVVYEGETVTLEPVVSDPQGDEVTIKYTGWMTSDTRETTYEDAGEYVVTITASDSELMSQVNVGITVKNRNRAPTFEIEIG